MCLPKSTNSRHIYDGTLTSRAIGTVNYSPQQTRSRDELDEPTTSTTVAHQTVPQSLPLLIGPIQVIPIADTLSIDFIPPPYFVVEVDDGIDTNLRGDDGVISVGNMKQYKSWGSWFDYARVGALPNWEKKTSKESEKYQFLLFAFLTIFIFWVRP